VTPLHVKDKLVLALIVVLVRAQKMDVVFESTKQPR
jgi:hypothetical protein